MSPFQRTGFKIKPNHSNALPRYILSISVESEREQLDISGRLHHHVFRSATVCSGRLVGCKIIGRKVQRFGNVDDFWAYIFEYTRPNYTTWLVGHSVLSRLILSGLPHRFSSGELSIDRPRSKRTRENNEHDDPHSAALAVLENPPTIIGCRVGQTQGRLVIVDLLNWFSGELSTIEAAIGFGPPEENADRDSVRDRTRVEARQACSIHQAFEGLISFVAEFQMGLFRYTASGQAMGAFRHRFMRHNIYVHDNESVQRQERKAYFGGRSDVFKKGLIDETVYQLDVNALFPSVMAAGHFPYILNRWETRLEPLGLLPSIDYSASVAEVELHTAKPLYPLRSDLHIIYPIGTFRTYLCGMELYRAHTTGCITKIGSWSEYKLAPIFDLWVSELWQMRQSFKLVGNALYEQLTKRLMNSLYGKFAQLTPSWVNVQSDHSMLPFTTESRYDSQRNEWTTLRSVGWQVQKLQARAERPGSFYAVSAFVTSAARVRMDYLRLVCGRPNVYYQGIDSIITNGRGYQNLIDNGEVSDTELGKLRLQRTSNYGAIRGIADYEIGDHKVLASRALNHETTDIGDVLQHKQYVADHLFKAGPISDIWERTEQWIRRNDYSKGVVGSDGWVSPFVLGSSTVSSADDELPDVIAASAS